MDLFEAYPLDGVGASPYTSESRGIFGDLVSALFRGTASTTVLTGQGLQQIGLDTVGGAVRGAGESMQESEWNKPDRAEYLGLDNRAKQIAMGVAENVPFVAGTIGSAALGGGIGAAGFLGISAGAGTYKAMREELDLKQPEMSEDEKHWTAFKEAAIQLGTESVGSIVGLGAGKLFTSALSKPVLQAGLRGMVESGEITAEKLIASSIGKTSIGDLSKSLTVAGLGEGSSEVAAQLLSEANREAAGLENDPSDLFNVFASAAILGGSMGAVGYKQSATNINRMKKSIEFGLSNDDINIRQQTVEALAGRLEKLDPEASAAFQQTIGNAAISGPIDIKGMFEIQREYPGAEMVWSNNSGRILTPSEANIKNLEDQKEINKITQSPSEVLKESGIPSGVAMSPYGTASFVEDRSVPSEDIKKPYSADRDIPQSAGPGPASYTLPGSIPERTKAIEAGMAKVAPDSNQVIVEEKKVKMRKKVPQTQKVSTTVVDTPPVTKAESVKTEAVKIDDDLTYTAEDLKGIEVEVNKYDPVKKESYKAKESAYKALDDIEEETSLYEDIKRCLSKS